MIQYLTMIWIFLFLNESNDYIAHSCLRAWLPFLMNTTNLIDAKLFLTIRTIFNQLFQRQKNEKEGKRERERERERDQMNDFVK